MELKKNVILLLIVVVVVTTLSSVYMYVNKKNEYKEISYVVFLENLNKEKIEEVKINNGSKVYGNLKDGTLFVTDNPKTENFKETLLMNNIKVVESEQSFSIVESVIFLLFIVGIGVVGFFINKSNSKQAQKEIAAMSNIGNEESNNKETTFEDIAGNEEVKESLTELVDFIRSPEKYSKYGARMPRGILLYGPPGTGKTLFAKALAGEANVPFYPVSGSDFIQVYAGLGASRIRELFKKAKKDKKSVIFIDEIDALGKKRKGNSSNSGSEEGDRTLNALLTEMSGFDENEGIIVVAATNRMDTLDEALLRPGRFDRQIEVGLPDINARHKILKLHSINKPLDKNVDLYKVASETIYFSGAKLENLMNESAMLAAKANNPSITMEHINKAFYTVLVGEEKKDREGIHYEDKKITAYHEAGHALVTKKVSPQNRITKVSIIPSTKGSGGFSMNIPPERMYQSKQDIINNIMVALGGRAAEEIVFGNKNITTGASNDLQKVTEMALSMISLFGMDEEIGLVNYEVILKSNLETDSNLIDRVKELIDKLYIDTKNIIMKNDECLDTIANKLLEKEVLNEEELNKIFLASTLAV